MEDKTIMLIIISKNKDIIVTPIKFSNISTFSKIAEFCCLIDDLQFDYLFCAKEFVEMWQAWELLLQKKSFGVKLSKDEQFFLDKQYDYNWLTHQAVSYVTGHGLKKVLLKKYMMTHSNESENVLPEEE